MKQVSWFLLLISLSVSVLAQQEEQSKRKNRKVILAQQWASEPDLATPESVCYDSIREVLYVSNINGVPLAKDSNGFISRLSTDGSILEKMWITGLNAPKGMGIFGGRLFVSDIDRVVEIAIDSGQVVNQYDAEGAQFLNDIAIDKSGKLFVSDMHADRLYYLADGRLEPWLELDGLSPNGLYIQDSALLVGTNGSILSVNLSSKETSVFIDSTCSVDGLVPDGRGGYLISDWRSKTYLVHPNRKPVELLDTTEKRMNAADIEFIVEKSLLLIPTFGDNRVVAYRVKF